MSYSNFEYKNLSLNKTSIKENEELEISVNVSNTGLFDRERVVQLYVSDLVASITRPLKDLKGFQKIKIAKGETKKVTFTLTKTGLAFYNSNLEFKTENGEFEVFVGTNSQDCLSTKFYFTN